MKSFFHCMFVLLVAAGPIGGCASGSTKGSFGLLTYNVSGLLQGISKTNSIKNIPLISPLLNHYELVLVQEDFHYHERLVSEVHLPYRSTPKQPTRLVGDGLNRFSIFSFERFERLMWTACNGLVGSHFDCLSEKGLSVAEHRLASAVPVDVYNLHMDAGRTEKDHRARAEQVKQLLQTIEERSTGKAVIVAGDTNLGVRSEVDDVGLLDSLLSQAGLDDACYSIGCAEEHYDRILFRSSDELELTVTSWEADARFVDIEGGDLSDHKAISAQFHWELMVP